jgi:hypothetical protein
VALAALIAAYRETGDGVLCATLPLAGRSVVERQARLAASAGAEKIVLLLERLPPDLIAAIDRLRREGVSPIIARSVEEAARTIEPQDRLMMIADGMVADPAHFERVAALSGKGLLTLPDQGYDDRHERIDHQTRWAGLAMLDGASLRDTAAMLGEWDLQSTLLRRAVQAGVRQIAAREDASNGFLHLVEGSSDLATVEGRIAASAAVPGKNWLGRFVLAPIERWLTRLLLPTAVTSDWLRAGMLLLVGLSAFLFARQWLWPGLVAYLLATPLPGVARRLASIRLTGLPAPAWAVQMKPLLDAAAMIAFGHALVPIAGWGSLLLALVVVAFARALRVEAADRLVPGADWLAEPSGMAWLILPFAAGGYWLTGLAAVALYASMSFFWVQREVHRATAPAEED